MPVQELGKSRVIATAAGVNETVIAGCAWRFAFGAIVVEGCVSVRTLSEAFGQIQIRMARKLVTLGTSVGIRTLSAWDSATLTKLGGDLEAPNRALIRETFLLLAPIEWELVFTRDAPCDISRLIILSTC